MVVNITMSDDRLSADEEFRRISDTSSKLEAIQVSLESVIDFFATSIVKLHNKLSNDSLKFLIKPKQDFKYDQAREVEELLWRRIYHDLYRFQKAHRHYLSRQDKFLLESHFIAGIGFYSGLIIKLRYRYKFSKLNGLIESLNFSLGPIDNLSKDIRLNEEDVVVEDSCQLEQDWARQAIHRSLVYMGDLSRYLMEVSQFDYRKLSFDFYRSASQNQPETCGRQCNQLATIESAMNELEETALSTIDALEISSGMSDEDKDLIDLASDSSSEGAKTCS